MDQIIFELTEMNIDYKSINILQEKDGVIVARINCENKSVDCKIKLDT